jgi:hypothetical protein
VKAAFSSTRQLELILGDIEPRQLYKEYPYSCLGIVLVAFRLEALPVGLIVRRDYSTPKRDFFLSCVGRTTCDLRFAACREPSRDSSLISLALERQKGRLIRMICGELSRLSRLAPLVIAMILLIVLSGALLLADERKLADKDYLPAELQFSDPDIKSLVESTTALSENGDYDQAIRELEKALELSV